MTLAKRYLILLIVLGLSLGLVTAVLAAADTARGGLTLEEKPMRSLETTVDAAPLALGNMHVNYAHSWVGVETEPFAVVTVTLSSGYLVTGTANEAGWFITDNWPWIPENPFIFVGDIITAETNGLQSTVNPVGQVSISPDFDADTVAGTIDAPWFSPLTLAVSCEIWEEGAPGISVDGVNPDGGGYFCDFDTEGWDLQPGQMIAVRYWEPDGDSVINIYDPWMRVNYAHDWVGGDYELGHTFWITVTESDRATVKATAQVDTWPGGGWGGHGFETWDEHWNTAQPPDIMPGDWVFFLADDGYANEMRIGTINGTLDIDDNSVGGPIYADFAETLDVHCSVWVEEGPDGKDSTAGSNGSPEYFCQWDSETEWDIRPGDDVAVMYYEPDDGDMVINVFREPAPDMWIEKWSDGSGQVMPGGPVVYNIRYGNDGDAEAANFTITDTLPSSTTYYSDTSSVEPTFGTGWVSWELGPLAPGEDGKFQLVLNNTADSGDGLHNQVDVYAEFDPNPDNNQAGADVEVVDGVPDLYVNKNPNPGDPAGGQLMLWEIDYGNQNSVASGMVVLTDTIPEDTTVVDWYSNNGYDLWYDYGSTDDQLVLAVPSIPGHWGDILLLWLQLGDIEVGTQLTNTVEIFTEDESGDTLGDNWHQRNDVWTNEARWDGYLNKQFDWGRLVPGGEIQYSFHVRNQGNQATNFELTDLLPDGTSYDDAWIWTGDSEIPFPPDSIEDGELYWDLGVLLPGEWVNFSLRLRIDSNVEPGTVIDNCAEISIDGPDSWPSDNKDCVAETVNDYGPNLRVTKWHDWRDDNTRLEYTIFFENIGDEIVNDVWITDTLPTGTTWNGWWHMEFDWERLISESLNSDMLLWQFSELNPGDVGWIYFDAGLDNPDDRPGWYTNTVEIDIPPDDIKPSDNYYEDVAVLGEVEQVDFYVDTEHSSFWGQAQPGVPITVTTPYTEVYAWADPGCDGCWDIGDAGEVWPGDQIEVRAGAGLLPVIIDVPDPFTAQASSQTDQVWGQIDHLDQEWIVVAVDDGGPYMEVQTDGDGNYEANFSDLWRGARGEVRYHTMVNYAEVGFHRQFQTPDLILAVNYGNDGVDGNYEPGHTGWITVTESDRVTVKATVEIETAAWPWWDGGTGFSTNHHEWSPQQPDIFPGDWVFGLLDNGESAEVQVGEITGHVDKDNDSINGTLDVDWLMPGPVDVDCQTWGAPEWAPNPQNKWDSVLPDGADPYACSWDPDNEWDVDPGQQIGVVYTEPDSRNQVMHGFSEPAPYLQIQKWANGQPGEGGNIVFSIQYVNQGDATAENVVITDTMLSGMTYLADTSDLPSSGSGAPGDPLLWDVGSLDPGDWIQFEVYAEVTASSGEWITNTAEIATSNPYDQGDPGEKYQEWSGEVLSNDTHLNVGKWAWTGDPAPGYEFVWAVNVCNNGSTDSSQVILTDTLPISTTLLNWWGQHADWEEVSQDSEQLVVSRPSLQSGWCSEVYLKFEVDEEASYDVPIINTAIITASNDLESEDNVATNEVWVHPPYTNLSVDKWWNWGQLVPGGQIAYGIGAHNNGNLPVDNVFLTDTLPVNTTLIGVWAYDRHWNYIEEVIPTVSDGEIVVWEVGTLENGDQFHYEIQLAIDSDALPGTELVNGVEITHQPGEASYDDNYSELVEYVYDHGPNLRIRKDGSWDDWGSSTRRASYWLNVENVGDEAVEQVVVTDTYDNKMYMEGGIDTDWGKLMDWEDHPDDHFFTATFDRLGPGESTWLNFGAITDTEPLPFGLIFLNNAEVILDPDDTNPEDNADEKVLTTGPDLYTTKDLIAGDLLPGELITFSLTFGNDHQGHEWWWNMQGDAFLTDTLPDGLEYITSTLRWCGDQEWCSFQAEEFGNELSWNLGQLNAGDWNEIHLTVQISNDAEGDDIFTNEVEITSSEPISDTEPFYDNNFDSYDVVVALPKFTVSKSYQSSEVAGMPITYTLTVLNSGSVAGTSVLLQDTLPANLTYVGGDGTLSGGVVRWTLANINPAGGTANGWFNGTLSCTAGVNVNNQHYLVTGSDQGVTSENGAPVSFNIIEPTITAVFTYSANSIVEGDSVNFTGLATTNGIALSYAWDFGDGNTGTGQNPSHTYTTAGSYDVTLTVTDGCGFTKSVTIEDAVTVASACTPLTGVDFAFSPQTPYLGTSVSFTATPQPALATQPITYQWDFDDGSIETGTEAVVQHVFMLDKTYTVSLMAKNACTPLGVTTSKPVTVVLYQIYLPLVSR